jgi:hypothetical protein
LYTLNVIDIEEENSRKGLEALIALFSDASGV